MGDSLVRYPGNHCYVYPWVDNVMNIKFVKGFKLFKDSNLNFLAYRGQCTIGQFMSKETFHLRYNNCVDLKRVQDSNKSFILVVIQDNLIETLKTLLHELFHWINFETFHSKYLNDLLHKIDNPK